MYQIQNTTQDDLLTRLLSIRWITDKVSDFMDPTFENLWRDPFTLNDMEIAVDRIIQAIKSWEKIMIFWDYDVDGVTSSWVLYTFFRKFLNYENISVRLPNRLEDGYGIKNYHLDHIKELGCSLVITVDNWITAVGECQYAKEIGLDVIITDHHKNLDVTPEAVAIVNPHVSPDYDFKWLCGASVAFKLISALIIRSKISPERRQEIFRYMLPVVAIGTVCDCVPLVDENRLFVKKWLEMINSRDWIPEAICGFLDYVWVKKAVTTETIWFVIWPRINAWGRILSPIESFKTLIFSGEKQLHHLEKIDKLNTERRNIQEKMLKIALKQVSETDTLMAAWWDWFHEWVVGIVAGRLTEKYFKPSIVYGIDHKKWVAVASLRWPSYFSVIDMLYNAREFLSRYGWHKQAWWCTIELDKLEQAIACMREFCDVTITSENLVKITTIDTVLYPDECNETVLKLVWELEPFGESNPNPIFVIPQLELSNVMKVWTRGQWHLKLTGRHWWQLITALWWSHGNMSVDLLIWSTINVIGRVRMENMWRFIDIIDLVADDQLIWKK